MSPEALYLVAAWLIASAASTAIMLRILRSEEQAASMRRRGDDR